MHEELTGKPALEAAARAQEWHASVDARGQSITIALVSVAHAVSHYSHMALPTLFPLFAQEFGVPYSRLGLLVTIFFAVSALGQAFSGFVVDRLGARPVLYSSMVFYCVACIVAAMAQGYVQLLVCAVLTGLANAPFHPANFSILTHRISAARLGYAYGIHGFGGNVGWAAGFAFITGVTWFWGNWRYAYIGSALLYAGVLLILVVWGEYVQTDAHRDRAHRSGDAAQGEAEGVDARRHISLEEVLRLPALLLGFCFVLITSMGVAMMHTVTNSVLIKLFDFDLAQANSTIVLIMSFGAIGMLVGGAVATRYVARTEMVITRVLLLNAVLLGLCSTEWASAYLTCALFVVVGFNTSLVVACRELMIKAVTPRAAVGRVYGIVYSGADVGLAIAPPVFGWLIDQQMYRAVFFVAGLCLGFGALIAWRLGETKSTRRTSA